MTSLRLDTAQQNALAVIAGRRGCTKTDLIRVGINLVIAADNQENAPPAGNGRRAKPRRTGRAGDQLTTT